MHIMQIAQCTIYSNRRVGIQATTILSLSHIFHIFSSEKILLIFLSEPHFSHFLYIGISPHFLIRATFFTILRELHSPHFLIRATFSSFSCQSNILQIFLNTATFFTFSYQSYILLIFLLELHSSNFLDHSHILHNFLSVLHSPYFLIIATFSSFLVPATPDCTCQIFQIDPFISEI